MNDYHLPLGFQRQHHISGKDNRCMCSHCIIREKVAFFTKFKIAFADFEENFDIPPFSLDADDFIFI